MSKGSAYERIAITLPADVRASADALSRQHQRSRSWVVAEAIRHYAGASRTPPAVNGLGEYRARQLGSDFQLTPEARVRIAEETASVSLIRTPRSVRIVAFTRYEDYLDWKRLQEFGIT